MIMDQSPQTVKCLSSALALAQRVWRARDIDVGV
jgi:hypothetical protein